MTVKVDYNNIDKISKIILFHRKLSGLSRNELADIAGVGKTVIFDIEHGKESVKINTLLKVMSVLNIQFIIDSPVIKQYEETIDEKS